MAAAEADPRWAPIEVLDKAERAHQGSDEITAWCPKCEERVVPMRDGSCGWCESKLDLNAPEPEVAAAPVDAWPHTENVVRKQVTDEEEDRPGAVKRQRLGDRARGPILKPIPRPEDDAPDVEAPPASRDPTRSPILEWLERHQRGSAPQIAEHLNRKPANVSTRLRQLEQGGFVRRTGKTLPGGRGGPQIEWELCDVDKPPTGPEDVLTSPLTPPPEDDLRRRYFEHLLALATADAPAHIFDRLEKLIETRS